MSFRPTQSVSEHQACQSLVREPLQDFSETDSSPYYNAVIMVEEELSSRLGDANWPLKRAVTRHPSPRLTEGCGMNDVVRAGKGVWRGLRPKEVLVDCATTGSSPLQAALRVDILRPLPLLSRPVETCSPSKHRPRTPSCWIRRCIPLAIATRGLGMLEWVLSVALLPPRLARHVAETRPHFRDTELAGQYHRIETASGGSGWEPPKAQNSKWRGSKRGKFAFLA